MKEAKLEEAMRAAQEALRAAEQEDVEWGEDDMNDPALLAEMERLERGEEVESKPVGAGRGVSTYQQ